MKKDFLHKIFTAGVDDHGLVMQLFSYQYHQNKVYNDWCNCFKKTPENVQAITDIPFLPVSFFKTHKVVCNDFVPEAIFESSGTTQTINSRHYIKDIGIYQQSFLKTFEQFYGPVTDYCIIGLLPSYLERKNASLVRMTDDLIKWSGHEKSGYYLNDFEGLAHTLQQQEATAQKTILFGVTFALLDFAEQYSFSLQHTILMDTGGMKGRKKELTRDEVHAILKKSFSLAHIHSEYGMTELLSQAYARDGLYTAPNWLKLFVRDETDPLLVKEKGKGLLNVLDMANVYSCAFLATDDVGTLYDDGKFSVWGRRDNSDLRGCSLMVL